MHDILWGVTNGVRVGALERIGVGEITGLGEITSRP
jgi:hypothetical protein